jgi:hypothetical protein
MTKLVRVTAALLLVTQGACTTLRVVPAGYVASDNPGQIWITSTDRPTELRVFEPRIETDTLFGLLSATEEIALPVVSVREVKARRIDAKRTALFSVAMAGIATTLGVIAFKAAKGPQDPNCELPPGQVTAGCR